jgi:single-strand DNA-binding protein
MSSFNKSILLGNLTRDPSLKYTPKGTAVCQISLAVNRKWKSETGEMKEEVSFIDCEAFGKTAETIGQYCKKGRPLLVEGRLRQDTWQDKASGQNRSKLKVIIESFQFIGGFKESGDAADRGHKAAEAPQADAPEDDSSVPF